MANDTLTAANDRLAAQIKDAELQTDLLVTRQKIELEAIATDLRAVKQSKEETDHKLNNMFAEKTRLQTDFTDLQLVHNNYVTDANRREQQLSADVQLAKQKAGHESEAVDLEKQSLKLKLQSADERHEKQKELTMEANDKVRQR